MNSLRKLNKLGEFNLYWGKGLVIDYTGIDITRSHGWILLFIPTWQSGGWDRTDCFGFLKSTRGFGHQRGGLEEVERCGFQYFAIRRLRHAQGLRETMEGFRKYLVVYKTSDLHRLARFAEFSCLCHLTCG